MKYLALILGLLCISQSWSQQLPRKSSFSEVTQRVGLNDITIAYSRPNVNNRVIFGELVPYGEVWRLGANQPTKIRIKEAIVINGQTLDTGYYAMFAVPEKNFWTVVFNTDTEQWGSNSYDEKKNVLSYQAAVNSNEHIESFSISFESVNESSAVIAMEWANVKVLVPFTTDTKAIVERGFDESIAKGEDLGRVYFNIADYYNDEGEIEKAKSFLEKSLAVETSYYNLFLKADMMKSEDLKGANKLAEEAAVLAEKAKKENWAGYIRRKAGEWK
jgi:tetratricopeptide (TPR) repeat protein